MIHNPVVGKGKTSKLNKPLKRPGVVLKRLNNVLYRVKMRAGRAGKLVHFNRLKRFPGDPQLGSNRLCLGTTSRE